MSDVAVGLARHLTSEVEDKNRTIRDLNQKYDRVRDQLAEAQNAIVRLTTERLYRIERPLSIVGGLVVALGLALFTGLSEPWVRVLGGAAILLGVFCAGYGMWRGRGR